ncbi:hypothetical protein AC623_13355 [Bacillus sp. FJAT-27231]|uniref:hypothetical protein n=1 Tax=Bacillus sp. FJAT-27231 TaxID=1679168 RepID=UPI00067084B5|nr:hypothetical protein [Bacillus sp. FJAT-27231]KMY54799.1 hypothetical protein AC623_13355 [Bacillus sp. FJAT-27231]
MEVRQGVSLQTPTERPKPPYGLAAATGQQKSGRRLFSAIADWSSRREVAFQTSIERAKSAYALAPAAGQ